MKQSLLSTAGRAPGSVRVVSKRRSGTQAQPHELVISADRSHPVLGNRHVLHNPADLAGRERVIEASNRDVAADMAAKGPIYGELLRISELVKAGAHVALACWCAPRSCHADAYCRAVAQMASVPHDPSPALQPALFD